ncbi:hypothetical protein GEMRC1_003028 [Eukaryota sp. GEM-RC1]
MFRLPITVFFLLCIVLSVQATKPLTPELKCAACRTVVKMINDGLDELPKRNVHVGWRINAKGERVSKKIPLKKSAEGVAEVLDSLCDGLGSMGIFTNSKGVKSFKSLSGGSISGSFTIDGDSSSGFQRVCSRVADGFEEEISDMVFNQLSLDEGLCVDLLDYCEPEQINDEL